jgi:hypothetical protein
VRVPELALGVLVTVGCALGAVVWHLQSVDRVPVLAVAVPIARGETLTNADLRIVYVASDDQIATLGSDRTAEVVGRVASVDLAPGTLLTSGLVEPALAVQPGSGVVGLALDPGQFPARGIAPGDRVDVVAPVDTVAGGGADSVLVRGATVFAVDELASDQLLVSLLMDEGDAQAVAANATSPLRLVLVAP